MRRRELLTGMAGAAGLTALPLSYFAGRNAARAQALAPITVTAFGGIWEQTIREVMVPDYEKRTGGKADVLIGGPKQWVAQI